MPAFCCIECGREKSRNNSPVKPRRRWPVTNTSVVLLRIELGGYRLQAPGGGGLTAPISLPFDLTTRAPWQGYWSCWKVCGWNGIYTVSCFCLHVDWESREMGGEHDTILQAMFPFFLFFLHFILQLYCYLLQLVFPPSRPSSSKQVIFIIEPDPQLLVGHVILPGLERFPFPQVESRTIIIIIITLAFYSLVFPSLVRLPVV